MTYKAAAGQKAAADLNRRATVFKKAGIAVGIATVALVSLSPLAFADDHDGGYGGSGEHFQFLPGLQDHVIQHPVKACGHHELEGKAGPARNQHNSDSHDGDCDQDVSPSDD
jgi:hypothetical protein